MQYDLGSATNVASNPLLTVSIASNYINVTGQYTNTTANSVLYYKSYTAPATQTVHWVGENARTAGKSFPALFSLYFRDSTGKRSYFACYLHGNLRGLAVGKLNADLSGSADYTTINDVAAHSGWLRIIDDGANRICQTSSDGSFWVTVHTVARTDFLTPTAMGWYVNYAGATAGAITNPTYATTIWSLEGP
jgi:hypothetical protein